MRDVIIPVGGMYGHMFLHLCCADGVKLTAIYFIVLMYCQLMGHMSKTHYSPLQFDCGHKRIILYCGIIKLYCIQSKSVLCDINSQLQDIKAEL